MRGEGTRVQARSPGRVGSVLTGVAACSIGSATSDKTNVCSATYGALSGDTVRGTGWRAPPGAADGGQSAQLVPLVAGPRG